MPNPPGWGQPLAVQFIHDYESAKSILTQLAKTHPTLRHVILCKEVFNRVRAEAKMYQPADDCYIGNIHLWGTDDPPQLDRYNVFRDSLYAEDDRDAST